MGNKIVQLINSFLECSDVADSIAGFAVTSMEGVVAAHMLVEELDELSWVRGLHNFVVVIHNFAMIAQRAVQCLPCFKKRLSNGTACIGMKIMGVGFIDFIKFDAVWTQACELAGSREALALMQGNRGVIDGTSQ
jgi:hypothetical protein